MAGKPTTAKIEPTATERNYQIVKTISNGYTVITLGVSAFHIVSLFEHYNAGWQSFLAPVMIDGFVVLGKIADRPGIVGSARRLARTISVTAGTLSLAANIAAGWIEKAPGAAVIGVLAVIGFWVAEYLSHKLRPTTKRPARSPAAAVQSTPTPAPTPAAPPTKDPKKVEAALKAAATRAARKAKREADEYADKMEAEFAASIAPVSPALAPDTRAYL
jgi:hypothetical protein